jgi:5'-methylthioadenosine phosphorylase
MSEAKPEIAVIGGSGFYSFFDETAERIVVETPYGLPSSPITIGDVEGRRTAFLARHGEHHEFPPHRVPYRANLWALRSLGVQRVLSPCAVGSLTSELGVGAIAVPDQLVDRTTGRTQTFFDTGAVHVPFADPYCPQLRATALQHGVREGGTMVVIEGPRFSTRAESQWYATQGWSLINMTGHPEAVLARELELCFAAVALVTDLDAGISVGEGVRAADVFSEFERNVEPFKNVIRSIVSAAATGPACEHCRVHDNTELPIELP